MKRFVPLLMLLALAFPLRAQSYSDDFYAAFNSDDIDGQRAVLDAWQQANPEDVDFLIAKYNFYANQTMPFYVTADSLDASDGFSFYSQAMADSALMVINEAIEHYPNRLDLRFGKIYYLGEIGQWDPFADEIVGMLDHSDQIEHLWVYPNREENMVDMVLGGVLDYQVTMFNTLGDPDSMTTADSVMLMRMRRVAKRTIRSFPNDVPAINMLAVTYTSFKDYDSAIKYLLRAEQVDPTDEVVLQNLADNYKLKGDKKRSKQYQERVNSLKN